MVGVTGCHQYHLRPMGCSASAFSDYSLQRTLLQCTADVWNIQRPADETVLAVYAQGAKWSHIVNKTFQASNAYVRKLTRDLLQLYKSGMQMIVRRWHNWILQMLSLSPLRITLCLYHAFTLDSTLSRVSEMPATAQERIVRKSTEMSFAEVQLSASAKATGMPVAEAQGSLTAKSVECQLQLKTG